MNFCSQCGKPVSRSVPEGDNRERWVCGHCDAIHYQNPRVVVGCVPEHEGRILLCKRAIEPRYGFWTVPAGFLELDETLSDAAARETWEEALARVEMGPLIASVDVLQAGQVHVFFSATLAGGEFGAGEESLDAALYDEVEIPWDAIAFPSVVIALRQHLDNRRHGRSEMIVTTAPNRPLGS